MQIFPTPDSLVIWDPTATAAPWFAVYTRHQHERKVASRLAEQQLETFFPTYVELHRWKDRRKEINMPLFPGYVFFRGSLERRIQILSVPGVHFIVSVGQAPAAIPDREVDALRRAVHHRLPLEPFPFLNKGDRVQVVRGPLSGVEGHLVRKKDAARLVLSVEILGRSAAVEIDICDLKPCGPGTSSQIVHTSQETQNALMGSLESQPPKHSVPPQF
jgi:transcription antitermination factor NusG